MDKEKCLAINNGWEVSERQPDKAFLRFRRGEEYLDIWQTGTVRYIEKPQGATRYFRDTPFEEILKQLNHDTA